MLLGAACLICLLVCKYLSTVLEDTRADLTADEPLPCRLRFPVQCMDGWILINTINMCTVKMFADVLLSLPSSFCRYLCTSIFLSHVWAWYACLYYLTLTLTSRKIILRVPCCPDVFRSRVYLEQDCYSHTSPAGKQWVGVDVCNDDVSLSYPVQVMCRCDSVSAQTFPGAPAPLFRTVYWLPGISNIMKHNLKKKKRKRKKRQKKKKPVIS